MIIMTTASLLVAALSGCAANYPLDQSVSQMAILQVDRTSEATYRQMLGLAKDMCYQLMAEAQYYPEAKEGDITLVTILNSGNLKFTWAKFEIKPNDGGASVTVTYRKNMAVMKETALAWAAGRPAPCPY